jgi:hypothetical protein
MDFKSQQVYRLVNAICINTPIWLVSIYMNGVLYFLMYATQWCSLISTIFWVLVWYTASKEFELEALLVAY